MPTTLKTLNRPIRPIAVSMETEGHEATGQQLEIRTMHIMRLVADPIAAFRRENLLSALIGNVSMHFAEA